MPGYGTDTRKERGAGAFLSAVGWDYFPAWYTNPVKICIVTTAFPRWAGDFRAIFVYEAAQALKRQGCQVRVIAMHNPGAKKREEMNGVEVIRLPYAPRRWEVLQKDSAGIPAAWKQNPAARLLMLPFMAVHTWAVAKYAADCDIIHANWTLSAASAWASQWVHRRPFVVTVQGSDIFQAPKIPLVRQATRLALQRAGRVMALSRSLADATAALGIPGKKISVVPNGVNLANFPHQPGAPRESIILYAGTLIPRKAPDLLIRAMPEILARLPDYRLVLVGEGEMRPALESLAAELNLGEKVMFVGTQTQQQVGEWMRKSGVFVLPSYEEGQGVVLVEALASGTPCVGTTAGGIPDVVTEDVGAVVPPGDVSALAQAIIQTLVDPVRWETLCRQARQRAETVYDWDQIAQGLISIYKEVIGR